MRDSSKFKTMDKAIGNHSTISLRKLWQLTDNKVRKAVESYDCLCPEGIWHLKMKKNFRKWKLILLEYPTKLGHCLPASLPPFLPLDSWEQLLYAICFPLPYFSFYCQIVSWIENWSLLLVLGHFHFELTFLINVNDYRLHFQDA